MEINGKKLDGAKVAAAREIFEFNVGTYRKNSKGKLTFDELLERLTSDCNSLSDIAKEHGVTRSGMSYTYNHYFRNLFLNRKTGVQRQQTCTLKRRASAAYELPDDDLVAPVMVEAKRFGCKVKRVPSDRLVSAQLFSTRKILVQGKLCRIHRVAVAPPSTDPTKRKYGKLFVGKDQECEFRIVVTEFPGYPRRILVVPATVIPIGKAVFIPENKIATVYHNRYSKVDWWQYEGAWHLITA